MARVVNLRPYFEPLTWPWRALKWLFRRNLPMS